MKFSKLLSIVIIMSLLIALFMPIVQSNNIVEEDNIVKEEDNSNQIEENNIIKEEETFDREENNIIDDQNIIENKLLVVEDNLGNQPSENEDINFLNNIKTLETPSIRYKTHVQNDGWQSWKKDGKMSGTEGRSLRLEGIKIELSNLPGVNIKYQVHVQNDGWQSWKTNGQMAGTEGRSLRLEGIRILLDSTDEYSVKYRVHVQNVGWQDWKTDGQMAGTEGRSLRLEGIEIQIVKKQTRGKISLESGKNGTVYYTPSTINVSGWKMANVSNTTIKAYIDNIEMTNIIYLKRNDISNSFVEYGTALQNQNAGFKFSFDASSISSGNHTIKIFLYHGSKQLNTLTSTIKIDRSVHVSYRSHVQDIGWQGYIMDGNLSGTEGRALRVEAMNIKLINAPSNAKITYRTHVQDIGWQNWVSNDGLAGTSGQSKRIEALQIKLENLDKYTVEYRVHIQDVGWTVWFIDGETAGTVGQSRRIEAIQIRITSKYYRSYKGIDVSEYNGNIDWNAVKNSGIQFAYIRLGYRGYRSGAFAIDSKFYTNIRNAQAVGIPIGVYFFSQAINYAEGVEEANWIIQTLKNRDIKIQYPIMIDSEDSGARRQGFEAGRADLISKTARTDAMIGFCEKIQSAGYKPMIYASRDWFYNNLEHNRIAQYENWVAHYTGSPSIKTNYKYDYGIWQYTSTGKVSGISGNVDLDICYKRYY